MKQRLMIMLLIMLIVLTACGNNTNVDPDTTEDANNQSSLDTIKASGKLRIGTEGTYAPFSFHDDNGKLTGFDVEIAEEITKRLGLEPEFVEAQWDGLFAGMDASRFDVVFNEVAINDERKEKYDFSDPYIVSRAALIVSSDNEDIKTFADLKGKKSGQSLTSNLSEIARENGAEFVATDGFNQSIDLLTSGRIDATINDSLSFLDLKKHKPDVKVKKVDEIENGSQSAAVFLKGNDELIQAVNDALTDMKNDGKYLEISKKYFGTDVSI
ncbi:amino acid ABC transporter substrate-binding protein [Paenibacillus crassostreae]|uniref:Amino acid ABC transporter substrate-binding protein n=1 Tax=Paenibacillus crassostreae TaxID=1763538 RepID=A0A167G434_9BACL|nr:amino acid ABC transporter substrate-binding protein [Paenibacillus crassostreae]AOZ94829.1 amino acid ABC transporter substrate-binding protein [Paenibacillus crassostreae]OAB77195.1 amino acid ABC transporter substrate-binding protein [Paenibacillus crassostreae]